MNLLTPYMNNATLTALATVLLVLVGTTQVIVLITQKRQARATLANEYRKHWFECREHWGKLVFIGRHPAEYYQVVDEDSMNDLKTKIRTVSLDRPTIWAHDSVRVVCGILGEVCIRTLQGHLRVSDAYPILGTELLRHSSPLRTLLDIRYNGVRKMFRACQLSQFLRRAEYRSLWNFISIKRQRLEVLTTNWTKQLLRKQF